MPGGFGDVLRAVSWSGTECGIWRGCPERCERESMCLCVDMETVHVHELRGTCSGMSVAENG